MTEEGKYIYCIIKENKNRRFAFGGVNNREVALLNYKDIAAVVSPTPVIDFDRLDKEELTGHVTVHQKVNEQIMRGYDVVPMAFGIIAPNIAEVLHILERAYLQFKIALKELTGKAEFAVQVWWDQKKLLEEIANTSPKIQKLKQAASLKAGILGMPIKLKLGKLIHQQVELHRQSYIKDVQATLGSFISDFTLNKLIDEDMIANFSFLVERAREPELDEKMQDLGKKYEGKLKFKYIGPMPPYSFVNINLSIDNFELIDGARKLLGLDWEATFNEIQKTYYLLAHQYHPDKHQADTGLEKFEEQMRKINQAYSILENYCRSCAELTGKDFDAKQKCSFKEKDIKDSVLIH